MAMDKKKVGWISAIIGVLSLYTLYTGYNMGTSADLTTCSGTLKNNILIAGGVTLLLSLAGIFSGYQHSKTPFYLYFAGAVAVVIAGAWEYNHLTSAVQGSGGHPVPSRTYQEYTLSSYTGWLVGNNGSNWEPIKTCIMSKSACESMTRYSSDTQEQFFNERLTPIESGCCKPPTMCGFQIQNATSWIMPTSPGADPDCAAWKDDGLCYDCSSCQAGFLESVKERWAGIGPKIMLGCIVVTVVCVIQFYLFTTVAPSNGGGKSKESNSAKSNSRSTKVNS